MEATPRNTLNEDWLKSRTWDLWRLNTLITTVPDFLWALGESDAPLAQQQAAIEKFTKNPSWIPAPQKLKNAVAVFLASGEIQKGDLPGHVFHGNQYQAGVGGSGGESHWKPVMTKAEAKQWVKDSGGRFTLPFYHGTSTMSAALIGQSGLRITETGSAGSGIYLTDSQNVAGRYADEQQRQDAGLQEGTWEHNSAKGDILSVYTNVKNVADTEQSSLIIGRATTPPPFTNEPYPEYQAKLDKWKATDVGESIKQQAISEGFDAMMYRPPVLGDAQVGATYLVVFNPKNVVVVANEVKKGDLPGHLFHGNQWEQVGSVAAPKVLYHGTPADFSKLASKGINGSKSRLGGTKGTGMKYVSMTDNPRLARTFGKNVVAIDTSDMKFLNIKNAITIGRGLSWPDTISAVRGMGLPEYVADAVLRSQSNGGEIAFGDKKLASALKADGYDGVVFDSPDAMSFKMPNTKEYRIFTDIKPEQIKGLQEVVQKGDLPGHVFHGNQWQDGEGGGISRFERFPKPEEVGGEKHYYHIWTRPVSWYPNNGQDPEKTLVPRVPNHDDLLNAARQWKSNPKMVRSMLPEVVAGIGNPPWATVAQQDDRAACAALMNEVAMNPQTSEGTLWRGMTLGNKDSTMEEIMQRFQVGSTVDVPVSGFSENRNQSMRFAVGGVGRPKEEGIAVMYSLSSGAQGLPLDGNIYRGQYAYEKEWVVGGKLQIDKVETMGSGNKQYIKVSMTQTQPLTAPAGGFR